MTPRFLSPLAATTLRLAQCAPLGAHVNGWQRDGQRRSLGIQAHTSSVKPGESWPFVDRLNATLKKYPTESFAAWTGGSLGTFGAAFLCLQSVGFDMPALAVGAIVSRLCKRPRIPLDITLAATLAHAIPFTNALKLGPLLVPVRTQVSNDKASPLERRILAAVTWAEGPINKYGAPYMLVNWLSGMLTVSVATTCVHQGLDVVAVLSQLPFMSGSSVGVVTGSASCVAGAACVNSLLLPARLYLMSRFGGQGFSALAEYYASYKRTLRLQYKKQLRANPSQRGGNSR